MIRRSCGKLIGAVLVGLGLIGAGAQTAQAGLLPTLISVTPDISMPGDSTFLYAVQVPTGITVQSGDSFTLYDFGGYVPGTVHISGSAGPWTVLPPSLLTTPPSGLSVTDDPSKYNLSFQFTGSTPIPPGSGFSFWADSAWSTHAPPPSYNVASSVHTVDGSSEHALTTTDVPSSTPEPATLAMLSIGVPVMGAFQFFRRRRAVRKA